jgi:hypothetical protein
MKKSYVLASASALLTLLVGIFAARLFWSQAVPAADSPSAVPVKEFSINKKRLSGPYTHKNLTIYLVHGEDSLEGRTPLTLEEAMKNEIVIVHETGDVNELAVENLSAKEEVFIQAGDIVKGGQQDRILAVDLIIPARSGRMPIDSFCVEQGRWTNRGSESRTQFNSAADYAPSKAIKLAAKTVKSQNQVWQEVANSQEKLSAATNANTASAVSRSSLPLTLENERVREDSGSFIKALDRIVDRRPDAIGFLFLIKGEINSSEIYGSNGLFVKLWPKLLKSAAIEAIAEHRPDREAVRHTYENEIEAFLSEAESAAVSDRRTVTDRIRITTRDTKRTAYIETLDQGRMLHLSYISK